MLKLRYLHDPLLGLLSENDDIIAVDKPYGIDSHTNDSKDGRDIIPGLIEIFERNLGRKLHIIHRLDRTTTGVIIFGKSLESAKTYQQFFRNRESKKTYLFVTGARSTQDRLETDVPILHKGDELEAKTSFKNLARTKHFELWEALPKTGRNHQIRIHGAHVGLPLLGDKKYSGAEFPFLCLHNRRLEFPNGVVIESPAPKYFEDLAILEDRVFANRLHEIDRRQRLYRQVVDQGTDCLRLLQEQDAVLDLVDQDLSLIWNKPTWSEDNERGFEKLAAAVKRPLRRRFTKIKDQDVNPPPPPFAEQRLLRDWIRENSKDKTVAVLFSASNGTALAASQASELTLVDTSKSALNSARKQIANAKFLNRETLAYLDQCKTKQTKFDLIICDAPAFARGEKRNFKIENDLTELLTKMLDTLEPKGVLLFSTYVPSVYVNDLRVAFMSIRSKANFEITSLQSSLDCELPGEASNFKSLLIQT